MTANEKKPVSNKSLFASEKVVTTTTTNAGSAAESTSGSENLIQSLPSTSARRGRPSEESRKAEAEKIKQQESMKEVFTAEVWAPVSDLPFDLLYISTKYDGFKRKPEDSLRSGLLLAKVIEAYGDKIDPKTMVVVAFAVDYLSQLGGAVASWQIDLQKQKSENRYQKTSEKER